MKSVKPVKLVRDVAASAVRPVSRAAAVILVLVALVAASCAPAASSASTGEPRQAATTTGTDDPSATGFPVTVEADNGPVTLEVAPRRIVSLSTVSTEILFAIDAGAQVVAVDSQSNYPSEAPVTGLSSYAPNVEAIAELDPDLVFVSFDPGDVVDSLTALGVPVILHGTAGSLDDTYRQVTQTGAVTGHQAEAEALAVSMQRRIADAVDAAPRFAEPPTVYHEVSYDLWSATSSSFIGQIYTLFGLANIADAAEGAASGFPQLSAEYILAADPDLIMLGDVLYGENAGTVSTRPGWADLTAVRTGAVVELDTDVASRWGPRVSDLVEAISGTLRAWASDR